MQTLDFPAVAALAASSAAIERTCACQSVDLGSWETFPLSFELDMFEPVGTLLQDPFVEPTFSEYHPAGTRYDSADAPIAPRYFPYNRCEVAACRQCGRHYLRYSEAGGYFTEARIRLLQVRLLVDAPL